MDSRPDLVFELGTEGESGRPFLVSGDSVWVEPGTSLHLGDYGIFFSGERFVCHRVIGIRRNGDYRFKGDANAWCDGWVARQQVIGRVVGKNGVRFSRRYSVEALARVGIAWVAVAVRQFLFLSPWGKKISRWKRRRLGNRFPIGRWLGLPPAQG